MLRSKITLCGAIYGGINNTNLYLINHLKYTLLNANINVVQDNVEARHTQLQANLDVVQDNVAASVQLIPFTNVNTALGTSNCFFVGRNTTSDANIISVTLDGIMQGNTEFVFHHSNDTIQFKDASIPNGTIVTIFSLA